jgi:hypothetical protein
MLPRDKDSLNFPKSNLPVLTLVASSNETFNLAAKLVAFSISLEKPNP